MRIWYLNIGILRRRKIGGVLEGTFRLAVAKSGLTVSGTGYVVVEGAEGARRALPVHLLPDTANTKGLPGFQ